MSAILREFLRSCPVGRTESRTRRREGRLDGETTSATTAFGAKEACECPIPRSGGLYAASVLLLGTLTCLESDFCSPLVWVPIVGVLPGWLVEEGRAGSDIAVFDFVNQGPLLHLTEKQQYRSPLDIAIVQYDVTS